MQLLEHIHVNVDSIEATTAFLQAALPHAEIRARGKVAEYGHWAHFGDRDSYIALTEARGSIAPQGLRHIGLVVDDMSSLIERLAQAGYQPADTSALDAHPARRRVYYVDGNGVDWEFVQYLSDDPAQRNDYSQ